MIDENETNLESQETDDELEKVAEAIKPETVEESARAVFEELKGKTDEDETDKSIQRDKSKKTKEDKTSVDASEAGKILAESKKKSKKKIIPAAELEPETQHFTEKEEDEKPEPQQVRLEPPQRFPVEKKEWFNKQAREVQEEVVKGWGEIESHTTRLWQDLNREKNEVAQINQVIKHYAPQFHEQGLTEAQAVAELCATYANLRNQPLQTVDKMLTKMGITPEQLYEFRQNGRQSQGIQQNQNQSQNSGLTREELLSILQQRDQETQSQIALNSAVSEVNQVKNQVGNDGRYLYPELHDSNQVERIKPLVEAVRKTQQLSWGEATKQAIQTLRILDGKYSSPSSGSPGLSREQELAKVKAASVSVKSRGNGAIPTVMQAEKGESARESAAAVLAMFRNNQ